MFTVAHLTNECARGIEIATSIGNGYWESLATINVMFGQAMDFNISLWAPG